MAKRAEESNKPLLKLATFVMSCARTSIDEGQKYSPLRFLEVFRKLSDLPEAKKEPLIQEIRKDIDSSFRSTLAYGSDEVRIEFTDGKIRLLAAELKKRHS